MFKTFVSLLSKHALYMTHVNSRHRMRLNLEVITDNLHTSYLQQCMALNGLLHDSAILLRVKQPLGGPQG